VQRQKIQSATLEEEEPSLGEEPSKPLNETLLDLQLESEERLNITDEGRQQVVLGSKPFVTLANPLQKESVPRPTSSSTVANVTSSAMANSVCAAPCAKVAPLLSIEIRSAGMMF